MLFRSVADAPLGEAFVAGRGSLELQISVVERPDPVVAAWAEHADGAATALKRYNRVRLGDLKAARDAMAAVAGRERPLLTERVALTWCFISERVTRIELALPAWESAQSGRVTGMTC